MQLAVRIQHAKGQRERWVWHLKKMLGDTIPVDNPVEIVDNEPGNLWASAKKVLTHDIPKDATHILVLQDDILPCRKLIETAAVLAKLWPEDLVSLFSNHWLVDTAVRDHRLFIRPTKWLMAQAYIVPVAMAQDFVQWADRHIKPEIYFDDNRWAMYLWYHQKKAICTVPSLVEHLGWNETTLTGYQPGHIMEPRLRMARSFIGFEKSGLDIDWRNDYVIATDADDLNADFCHYYVENIEDKMLEGGDSK